MEKTLHSSSLGRIGTFTLKPDELHFLDKGYVKRPIYVFPYNPIWIQHEFKTAFISDPSMINFYNAAQVYERKAVNLKGDSCLWFEPSIELLQELLLDEQISEEHFPANLFSQMNAQCPRDVFLLQLRILENLNINNVDNFVKDELLIDELVIKLNRAVFEIANKSIADEKPCINNKKHSLIEDIKQSVLENIEKNMSLKTLAEKHFISPYHLSRLFKKITGVGLCDYRIELRNRMVAINIQADDRDLSDLAFDYGYSSHSHLTANFKASFKCTPSNFSYSRFAASS